MLEHLFKKRSDKYDVILYDNMYSPRYGPYLEDLEKWLPKEHLAMYADGITKQTGFYKNKWVGIPLCVDYSMMYYNSTLLMKHKKNIPKTWDELLETGKYILDREKNEGNEVIGYNGLFAKSEAAMCSFTEFLHSFRKTKESPYPSYSSQEAIDALNTLKRIKTELSTTEAFQEAEYPAIKSLNGMDNRNYLFVKYWNMKDPKPFWNRTALIGKYEGVSGTSVGLYNVGINKYSKNKKYAAKVIEYITSYDVQKYNITLNYQMFSGLNALYDDEDVCKNFDCKLAKNMQPIARPSNLTNNYDEYSAEFRSYLYDFLYGNKDAEETLNRIMDITRIHSASISSEDSISALIIFILAIILAGIMLGSFPLLFMEKFKSAYIYFSMDSWIIIFIGFFVSLSFVITEYGEPTLMNCYLKNIFLSVGYTLMYMPIIYHLISMGKSRVLM